MRIKNMTYCAALMLAISAMASCDNDDLAEVEDLAVKSTIELGGYYSVEGKYVSPKWQAGDKGTLAVCVDGGQSSAAAAPIITGSNSSLFLFNLEANREANNAVSWYPSDAEVRIDAENVYYTVPVEQKEGDIPVMLDVVKTNVNAFSGCNFSLAQAGCMVYVNVAMGDYEIASLTLTANAGEKLGGMVARNIETGECSASEAAVTYTPASPLSCRGGAVSVPVYCAPCVMSEGLTATIKTRDGETITSSLNEEITLLAGGKYDTDRVAEDESTELVFCGDNHVYVVNASIIKNSYDESVVWHWNAKDYASQLGLAASRCDHIDDCKFVDNGRKVLITSSYSWCALVDYETKEMLFHTTQVNNAHSAEYIPGGYIAIACSEGSSDNHSKIHLYKESKSESVLATAELYSAHGLVWDYNENLLYAAGGQNIKVFEITGADSDTPSLTLKKTIQTPTDWTHDLTRVDDNTLCVAGIKAYLFNTVNSTFEEIPLFAASTGIKSLNYNGETGEMWYTDATVPEGDQTWSSHKLRYCADKNASSESRVVNVNDINVYKVRVKNW